MRGGAGISLAVNDWLRQKLNDFKAASDDSCSVHGLISQYLSAGARRKLDARAATQIAFTKDNPPDRWQAAEGRVIASRSRDRHGHIYHGRHRLQAEVWPPDAQPSGGSVVPGQT